MDENNEDALEKETPLFGQNFHGIHSNKFQTFEEESK